VNEIVRAFETSRLLAEKIACARPASVELRERQALADFAAFGLFKRAALDPAALASLQKGLGWGVGLGLPALGVGHLLARDARHQGQELIRDARNQALLTAAGVGGMQALGGLLQQRGTHPAPTPVAPDDPTKIAAAIMVDDVLEAALTLPDTRAKHAALVQLIVHRGDAMSLVRGWLA
jgi:hypothetical protein